VTGIKIITENFRPKFIICCPQHYELKKKFSAMIETPVSICFVIPQRLYAKSVVFYALFE